MAMPDLSTLPAAYRGLNLDQSLAKLFYDQSQRWIDAELPLDLLKGWADRFIQATVFTAKQAVLREMTQGLIQAGVVNLNKANHP